MKLKNMIMAVALVLAANTSANAINMTDLVGSLEKDPVAALVLLCVCRGVWVAARPVDAGIVEKGFTHKLSDGAVAVLRPASAVLGTALILRLLGTIIEEVS